MSDTAELRLVDGRPVVTQAPEHIEMSGELYRTANRHHMQVIEHNGQTIITFGTTGFGLGKVAYRLIDRVRDTDTYHLERVA